jgi:small subunit ribosomal protein S20
LSPVFGGEFSTLNIKEQFLANHKSALKRNRQNLKKNERNKGFRTLVRTLSKKVRTEADAGNKEQAEKELKAAVKVIAKVGGKGILHARAASRKISGLTRLVNRTA